MRLCKHGNVLYCLNITIFSIFYCFAVTRSTNHMYRGILVDNFCLISIIQIYQVRILKEHDTNNFCHKFNLSPVCLILFRWAEQFFFYKESNVGGGGGWVNQIWVHRIPPILNNFFVGFQLIVCVTWTLCFSYWTGLLYKLIPRSYYASK